MLMTQTLKEEEESTERSYVLIFFKKNAKYHLKIPLLLPDYGDVVRYGDFAKTKPGGTQKWPKGLIWTSTQRKARNFKSF